MKETNIKIKEDGRIMVENIADGIITFKQIDPDSLVECINQSLLRGVGHTGLLPKNCLSVTTYDGGKREVVLLHSDNKADISYFGTEYKDFPLPRLVFGFCVSKEGHVGSCRIGIIANDEMIKPETKMFHYPLSNVSGFHLCTGNNVLPKCASLHTLASLPYLIMAMPNNNDHFKPELNKPKLEMRDLLELLKDKKSAFYYSDILIPNSATLNDFIYGRKC
jgi:hypothetical protein